MESGLTVTGSGTCKERVILKRQMADEVENKISNLPESLMSRILSLLPIKDAVRTCVLSKGWINRWTSITNLDLDDRVFYSDSPTKKTREEMFIDFVNRILLLTKCSNRESVSLIMSRAVYDVSLVNLWISSILNQGVKNLSIDTWLIQIPFSPLTSHSLFNSSSLEELVLITGRCSIRVPTPSVLLGNLKLLKLFGIIFTLVSFNNLELSLPVLKKFEMINCTWLNANGVTLKAPLLESVSEKLDHMWQPAELHNCAIKFSASHLTEFAILAYKTPQIILLNPSSVQNASAHSLYENTNPDVGSHAFQLLKQFSEVKYLDVRVLSQVKVADLPLFGMLCHLELCYVTGEVLLGLLLKSPILETLVVKVVEFGGVLGSESELCLGKFLMENGTVLKRMSFSFIRYWVGHLKDIEEFKEKIFSFGKGKGFSSNFDI